MRIRFVVTLLLMFSAVSLIAQTNSAAPVTTVAVPTLVRFSSTLPAASITVGVTFALYRDQTGGAPLWLETQNVAIDGNGRYTVNLGANHVGGIPAELFAAGEARWLGVQPEEQAEQPRVLLVSVPYAMKAADADTLGGLPASSYVTANQLSAASRQSPGQAAESAAAAGAEVTPAPCNSVSSDGTALANYLTKFTAPCNVEDSGIYQSALATTPGFLGIGTTAPVAPLDMEPAAQTGTSGGLFGVHVIANFNPTGNSTGNYYAFYGQSNSSMGNATNFTGDLVGSGFIAQHYGTGTVTNLFGANYSVQNRSTGTVTNAVGFYGGVSNLGAGTITNGYGLQVPVPQNSGGGVFTNFYGVYIANPTGITNSWGLYSLANTNYMSGKLGINVTAPTQALEINGNLKFDTAGHGITYADGTVQTTASLPGSGTITKVTAGTDLTGGGSSGAVTLNLDTTKVPTLAATTNTFTGTGGIHATSFTGDGTGVTNVDAVKLGGVAASGYPQLATFNGFTAAQNITGMGSGYILEAINNYTGSGSSAIYATSAGSNAVGVYGEADNGSTAAGIKGVSTSGNGVAGSGANYGGYFVSTGNTGAGIYSQAGSTTSAQGNNGLEAYGGSTSSAGGMGGTGIRGVGGGVAVAGQSNGAGVEGDGGESSIVGNGGPGVLAYGSSNGTQDNYSGGNGIEATGGAGTGNTTGGVGGYFAGGGGGKDAGPDGDGVQGYGGDDARIGVGGNGGTFVGGQSTGGIGGYGIYVSPGFGGTDMGFQYAGYFNGEVGATGSCTGGLVKSLIDHPLDPANKYLYHASVESSEMMNIYTGNVTTDGGGEAVVRLPDWFESLNTDFRNQFTVIGQFAQAIVAQEIKGHQFSVRTDKPNVKVSWQVTGVRQDAFAKADPLQVEGEKPERQRGYYVHPELYGAPHEKQVVFATHPNLLNRPAQVKPRAFHPAALPRLMPQQRQQPRPVAQNAAVPKLGSLVDGR